ncbi:MAG: CsbD family protein [Flavobacteriales bacterium]|nr:CsbD family protein [Flavobacteriales bacterium]
MNTKTIEGTWNEQKGRLKKAFAELTDNDLMYKEGQKDAMLGKIQVKLGKTKDEFDKIMASL